MQAADDQLTGNGSHQKRIAIIKKKLIGSENVFKDVLSQTIAAFETCVDEWASNARYKIGKLFGEVLTDFHSRFNNEEVEDDESKKAMRATLLLAVEEAKVALKGPLKAHIDECANYD